MKKLLLLASLIPFAAFGQGYRDSADTDSSDRKQKKFVKFVSISAFSGGDFYRDGFEDRSIFQQAAPSSSIAFADISGYTNFGGSGYYANTATTTGINVNLCLRCQKRFGELRFGFTHSYVSISSQSYYQELQYNMDTTALPGGQILYSDSIATSYYEYDWNQDVINLHVGWILRSDPRQWFNLYTGIGFFGGIGYNGIIGMSHSHASFYRHYSENANSNMMYTTNHKSLTSVKETFRAPGFTTFGIYTPIGFNIRLGTRHRVLRHIAFFGEYNGAIVFVNPEGTNSKVRTASSMYGGFRWYVHAPGKPKGKGKHNHGHRHRGGWTHGEEHMNEQKVD